MLSLRKNIGRLDQIIRTGISLLLIYVGFIDTSILNDTLSSMILGIIGCMSLFVAIVRICPLYSACGINTNTEHQED
ncbi:MAG: DUF2892 domain-containing protein [Gammaproteobacteria bacterium]|nr:DUF2892 domain-containing protein [Gammaproteobacteria bacterium]MCW8911045.1 DUF2892 domain-containing protein [Gammaproteobacteria bacterium]MCW9004525.1 DUF2892 domain-containing protein [Gammaproteobacteria bacterium]MCW9055990.1 DUF2892 domain-containing protein [Gammaproteobacteria bacterium]